MTNCGKNEDEDEKFLEKERDFWTLQPKLEKKHWLNFNQFLANQVENEDETSENEYDFWTLKLN